MSSMIISALGKVVLGAIIYLFFVSLMARPTDVGTLFVWLADRRHIAITVLAMVGLYCLITITRRRASA